MLVFFNSICVPSDKAMSSLKYFGLSPTPLSPMKSQIAYDLTLKISERKVYTKHSYLGTVQLIGKTNLLVVLRLFFKNVIYLYTVQCTASERKTKQIQYILKPVKGIISREACWWVSWINLKYFRITFNFNLNLVSTLNLLKMGSFQVCFSAGWSSSNGIRSTERTAPEFSFRRDAHFPRESRFFPSCLLWWDCSAEKSAPETNSKLKAHLDGRHFF
jgi:hypothetical protein